LRGNQFAFFIVQIVCLQIGDMTGARAGLVASIVHRWRTQGRIVATSRGQYRKTGGRGRRTRT